MSTSLLDDIWADALDPGYAEATARRRTGTQPPPSRPRRWAAGLVAAALIGAAVALAVTQVRLTRQQSGGSQAALVTQVQRQEKATDRLASTEDKLRTAVATARTRQLSTTTAGAAAAAAVDALELQTAAVAVVGPGVVLRISDARGATAQSGLVHDTDLQAAVNALWAAGAEAISVDGERLGPDTAIRTAGEAILVDFRPVSSPYVIDAIGDRNALETGYAASDAGARLQALSQLQGISVGVTTASTLRLAAATTAGPTLATALDGTGSSP